MNELGTENSWMAERVGVWDVIETAWDAPGATPRTILGLIAERKMVGVFLQETIRSATDPKDIKRIDYISFNRVEGRWKHVSMDARAAVGLMPAASFDRGEKTRVTLTHEPFAVAGSGTDVAGRMLRMQTIVIGEGENTDRKDQYFALSDGTGESWLAHRYAYTRRAR